MTHALTGVFEILQWGDLYSKKVIFFLPLLG